MQNCALEFILSTRHFAASSAFQANQHTKLDQAILFTRQIFVSECDVTSELYHMDEDINQLLELRCSI